MLFNINMKQTITWSRAILLSLILLTSTTGALAAQQESQETLAKGDQGIAAEHPGDRNIQSHDAVVFVENFNETSMTPVYNRWESARGKETNQLQLSDRVAPSSDGEASLLMKHIGGKQNTIDLYRRLKMIKEDSVTTGSSVGCT